MKNNKFKIYKYFCKLQWNTRFAVTNENYIILEEIDILDGILNTLDRLYVK